MHFLHHSSARLEPRCSSQRAPPCFQKLVILKAREKTAGISSPTLISTMHHVPAPTLMYKQERNFKLLRPREKVNYVFPEMKDGLLSLEAEKIPCSRKPIDWTNGRNRRNEGLLLTTLQPNGSASIEHDRSSLFLLTATKHDYNNYNSIEDLYDRLEHLEYDQEDVNVDPRVLRDQISEVHQIIHRLRIQLEFIISKERVEDDAKYASTEQSMSDDTTRSESTSIIHLDELDASVVIPDDALQSNGNQELHDDETANGISQLTLDLPTVPLTVEPSPTKVVPVSVSWSKNLLERSEELARRLRDRLRLSRVQAIRAVDMYSIH